MSESKKNSTVSNDSSESSNSNSEKSSLYWKKTLEIAARKIGKFIVEEIVKRAIETAVIWAIAVIIVV